MKLQHQRRIIILLVLTFTWGFGHPAASEETATPTPAKEKKTNPFADFSLGTEPISIRSRSLEFFYNEKRIVYQGPVVATKGDATLKSDLLTVFYEESEKNEASASKPAPENATAKATAAKETPTNTSSRGQRIKEIVAEGNVEITSENRRATSNKAIFNEKSRTVVLSGNAVLQEGANELHGQKVTVYIDEGRTVAEGGDEQVSMKIMPEQNEKKQKESRAR